MVPILPGPLLLSYRNLTEWVGGDEDTRRAAGDVIGANERRLIPGHWEGDLIKGAFNRSAVGAWAERSSCRVMSKVPAPAAHGEFKSGGNGVPEPMRKTLTYDQGKAIGEPKSPVDMTGVADSHADPRSPQGNRTNRFY